MAIVAQVARVSCVLSLVATVLVSAQLPELSVVTPLLPQSAQSFYNADPFVLSLPPLNSSFTRPLIVTAWDGSPTNTEAGKPLQELYFSVSKDDGASWTTPVALPIWGLNDFDVTWTPVLHYEAAAQRVFLHFTANPGTSAGKLYATSCSSSTFWNLLTQSNALFSCGIPQQIGSLIGTLTRGAAPLSAAVDPQRVTAGWHVPFLTETGLYVIHMQPVLTQPMEHTFVVNTTSSSTSAILTMSPDLRSRAVQLTVLDQSLHQIQFFTTADLALQQGWKGPLMHSDSIFAVSEGAASMSVGVVAVSGLPITSFLMVTEGSGSMRSTVSVIALTAEQGIPVYNVAVNTSEPQQQQGGNEFPTLGGLSLGYLSFDASLWTTSLATGFTPSVSMFAAGPPQSTSTALDGIVTQSFFTLLSVGGDVLIGFNATMRLNGTQAVGPFAGGPTSESPATATAITFIIICGVFFILLTVFVVGHIRAKRMRDKLEHGNEGASLLKPGDVSNTTSECHTIRQFE